MPGTTLGFIDRGAERAPYRQIADFLRAAVQQKAYQPGDRLPSEAALVAHFGVARMTVRHAIRQLRNEGLVRSEHGRGVFVVSAELVAEPAAGPLNRADLATLGALVERIVGQALSPTQSVALQSAYQAACGAAGGPTLAALVRGLGAGTDSA